MLPIEKIKKQMKYRAKNGESIQYLQIRTDGKRIIYGKFDPATILNLLKQGDKVWNIEKWSLEKTKPTIGDYISVYSASYVYAGYTTIFRL